MVVSDESYESILSTIRLGYQATVDLIAEKYCCHCEVCYISGKFEASILGIASAYILHVQNQLSRPYSNPNGTLEEAVEEFESWFNVMKETRGSCVNEDPLNKFHGYFKKNSMQCIQNIPTEHGMKEMIYESVGNINKTIQDVSQKYQWLDVEDRDNLLLECVFWYFYISISDLQQRKATDPRACLNQIENCKTIFAMKLASYPFFNRFVEWVQDYRSDDGHLDDPEGDVIWGFGDPELD